MINIKDKQDCCGCAACVQKCPKRCISFKEDKEGFSYPEVDTELCIACGLCVKVCPELHEEFAREPLRVCAAKNADEEIRSKSSSGGIFTLLAESVIAEGGVVFGARFNENWEVVHDYTEHVEGLAAFRGSKYMQSNIGETYKQAQSFLRKGRKVLFTGTPCQIAGLKYFLCREYANLLAVDIVCHGVPSSKVWKRYLGELLACRDGEERVINDIEFRSKSTGWKEYSVVLKFTKTFISGEKIPVLLSSVFFKNIYMRAFLANLILRPSCYACPVKSGKSGSDITIGDYWSIENVLPEIDDNKGCSLVLLNTEKAVEFYAALDVQSVETSYESALAGNPCLVHSVNPHPKRKRFFKFLDNRKSMSKWMNRNMKSHLMLRIKGHLKKILK